MKLGIIFMFPRNGSVRLERYDSTGKHSYLIRRARSMNCNRSQEVAWRSRVSSHDYPTGRSLGPYRAPGLVVDADESADATSSQKFVQSIFPSSESMHTATI